MTGAAEQGTQSRQPHPKRSQAEIEAEVALVRAELADSIDELTARLDPRRLATEAGQGAKQAATDTASLLTGKGMPTAGTSRRRNVKILIGVAAATLVLVGLSVARRR